MHPHPDHRAVVAILMALAIALCGTTPAIAAAPSAPLVRIPYEARDGSLTPYTFTTGYALMTLVYDTLLWRDEQAFRDGGWHARCA